MRNVLYAVVCLTSALAMWSAPGILAAPSAVTFTVDTTLDLIDGDTSDGVCPADSCSLRAAIMQANRISVPGGVTIILPEGAYTLTRPQTSGDPEYNGDLNLAQPVAGNPVIAIVGAGAATTIIDANQISRVLHVHLGRTATLSGVTIRNGYVPEPGFGGGIWNEGVLTVDESTFQENSAFDGGAVYNGRELIVSQSMFNSNLATYKGGGIYNAGELAVTDSTFSGNTATTKGGGIYNTSALNLSQSTLNGNTSLDGGGIYNTFNVFVTNSTLSLNDANTSGGGIHNTGAVRVYNSTIFFNGADADADENGGTGGGVYNAGIFNLINTLLAGNYVSGAPVYDECTGTLTSYGTNLIGLAGEGGVCTINQSGAGGSPPLNSASTLGPLQDNGGPTWTHALLPGSNAIDGGDPVIGCVDKENAALALDQRGVPRVGGPSCDIGAVELQPDAPTPTEKVYLPLAGR